MTFTLFAQCDGSLGCTCLKEQKRLLKISQRGKSEASRKNLKGHGTRSKYQRGCRCPACTKANTRYSQEWKASR